MRVFILSFFLLLTLTGAAQEICNNAIDDDNDGKIDLLDADCQCAGNFIAIREQSIILNPSFEEYWNCPTMFSQMALTKDWVQPSEGTSDYINTCGSLVPSELNPKIGKMPLPIPDGNAVVGIINGHLDDALYRGSYKEYVGTILNAPLRQNETYILEMYVGFSADASKNPPIEISVFGNPSREAFPIDFRAECPSQYEPSWKLLGSQLTGGVNEWVKTSIEFTVPADMHSIAIGPPCADALDSLLYYYLDNLVLYRKVDKDKVWLNIVESPVCDNSFTVASNVIDEAFTYQWFKDGIALPDQKKDSITFFQKDKDNGIYTLMVSNESTCQLSEPFPYTHILKKRNFADLGPDTITCVDNSITLFTPKDEVQRTGRYYLWSDGSANRSTMTVTTSGTYWLELRTVNVEGQTVCHNRDSINVWFEDNAEIDLGPEKFICDDTPVQLTSNLENAQHKWNTGATTKDIYVNIPGIYTDTVTINGCVITGSVQVSRNFLQLHLGNDIEVCAGKEVKIEPKLPAQTNFLWNKIHTSPVYVTSQPEEIILQAEYMGCYKWDTIQVDFLPSPTFDLGPNISTCFGKTLMFDLSGAGANYKWSTGSTDKKLIAGESGVYSVRVTDMNGCYTDDTINIQFQQLPKVELGNNLDLCRGASIKINPDVSNGSSFSWSDHFSQISRTVTSPGIYYLEISNSCGSAMDSIVVKDAGACAIVFPNAFTPNNDGKNDIFPGHKALIGIDHYLLQVFNRWGQIVFTTTNTAQNWDGRIKGLPAPTGAYIWKSSFKNSETGMMKHQNGTVLLAR